MDPPPPPTVTLRSPSHYAEIPAGHVPPPHSLLLGTWAVTHSTLRMWRTAQNVRISYAALDPTADGRLRNTDHVQSEPLEDASPPKKGGPRALLRRLGITGPPSSVRGFNTASIPGGAAAGSWDWRGKGLLGFVTSHWEVLGWGERPLPAAAAATVERWAVTWFAKTPFSEEGLDVYCDRPEGLSEETYAMIMAAIKGLEAEKLVELAEREMRPVKIVPGKGGVQS